MHGLQTLCMARFVWSLMHCWETSVNTLPEILPLDSISAMCWRDTLLLAEMDSCQNCTMQWKRLLKGPMPYAMCLLPDNGTESQELLCKAYAHAYAYKLLLRGSRAAREISEFGKYRILLQLSSYSIC